MGDRKERSEEHRKIIQREAFLNNFSWDDAAERDNARRRGSNRVAYAECQTSPAIARLSHDLSRSDLSTAL